MRAFFVFLAFISINVANAAPFEKGDATKGKALADKQCQACHVSLFKGDGSGVYTRADRKVKTPAQLTARVAACNANTGAGWFPEDEVDVAAHLNKTYYKFK